MRENQSIGGEQDWLDQHSRDMTYASMAESKYGKIISSGEVPQDAEYVLRHDAKEIKTAAEQDEEIKKITEADMVDPNSYWGKEWVRAAKMMHYHYHGGEYGKAKHKREMMGEVPVSALPIGVQGTITEETPVVETDLNWTDKDYAEWGLEFMGWFNYNIPRMGISTAKVAMLPDYDAETGMTGDKAGNPYGAMFNLMSLYDQKDITWNGTKRLFKGLATDPSTFAGLGTLGLAFLGRQGVKQTTKKGMMELLKRHLQKNTTQAQFGLALTEGGLYGGIDGSLRQSVNIMADKQDGFDFGRLTDDAVFGMLGGGVLQGGSTGIAKLFRSTQSNELDKIYDTASEAQENLISFLKEEMANQTIGREGKVITDIDAENVIDTPVKNRQTAEGKMKRKGYESAYDLRDIVRTAVTVDNPADARDVVNLIKNNFDIVEDDGYQKYDGGYFDYKMNVRTPEGNVGEIQILSREMAKIKPRLHEIFDETREMAPNVENGTISANDKARYEQLLSESDKLAAMALVADMATWGDVYKDIGFDLAQMQQLADTAALVGQAGGL